MELFTKRPILILVRMWCRKFLWTKLCMKPMTFQLLVTSRKTCCFRSVKTLLQTNQWNNSSPSSIHFPGTVIGSRTFLALISNTFAHGMAQCNWLLVQFQNWLDPCFYFMHLWSEGSGWQLDINALNRPSVTLTITMEKSFSGCR